MLFSSIFFINLYPLTKAMKANLKEKSILFPNTTFCIIPSDHVGLQQDEEVRGARHVVELMRLLTNSKIRDDLIAHGADELARDTSKPIDLSAVSIIISDHCDFPEFADCVDRLVPVAKPAWVRQCIEQNKLLPLRPYSVDPKSFMAEVSIVCVGLGAGDKVLIHEAMRAMGGTWTNMLTHFTTHVIATSLEHRLCQAVLRAPEAQKIKIVSPKWIQDCLKYRKLLDDRPYYLLNPGTNEEPDLLDKGELLEGKYFYLGEDLGFSMSTKKVLEGIIEQVGGVITDSLEKASTYVGEYRDGEEYYTASRQNLVVGNLSWLFWMIAQDRWTSPLHFLLHYPYVRGGLPDMHDMVISVSNYTGDARNYLQTLIEKLGATFTRQLRDSNTHLISAKPVGPKYLAAKNWNINTVNHLWLEETYAAWEVKSLTDARYIHAPKRKQLIAPVAQTELKSEMLKIFYEEDEPVVQVDDYQLSESDHQMDLNNMEPMLDVDADMPDTAPGLLDEPVVLQESGSEKHMSEAEDESDDPDHANHDPGSPQIVEKENEPPILKDAISSSPVGRLLPAPTPSPKKRTAKLAETPGAAVPVTPMSRLATDTSLLAFSSGRGRAAKDKAAAKLHQNMNDLNEFQKRRRTREIPLLPEEVQMSKEEGQHSTKKQRGNSKSRTEFGVEAPSSSAGRSSSAGLAEEGTPLSKRGKKHSTGTNKRSTSPGPGSSPAQKARRARTSHSSSPEPGDLMLDSSPLTQHPSAAAAAAAAAVHMNLLITGLDDKLSSSNERTLAKLGITLVSDPIKATHVIAPRVCKTQNFLVSLANGPVLLDRAYLDACLIPAHRKAAPGVDEYLLQDPASEASILHCTLAELQERARKYKGTLLSGYTFNVAPNIRGKFEVINIIVKAHGAHSCVLIKSAAKAQFSEPSDDGKVILLAAPEQQSLITSFKHHFAATEYTPYCFTAEWLLVSILRMQLDFGAEGAL